MIKVNQYMDILSLHKEGLSIRAIADRTCQRSLQTDPLPIIRN